MLAKTAEQHRSLPRRLPRPAPGQRHRAGHIRGGQRRPARHPVPAREAGGARPRSHAPARARGGAPAGGTGCVGGAPLRRRSVRPSPTDRDRRAASSTGRSIWSSTTPPIWWPRPGRRSTCCSPAPPRRALRHRGLGLGPHLRSRAPDRPAAVEPTCVRAGGGLGHRPPGDRVGRGRPGAHPRAARAPTARSRALRPRRPRRRPGPRPPPPLRLIAHGPSDGGGGTTSLPGMPTPGHGLRLGFIEPHLLRFGGIRRMLEFANRLTARGHDVTFYLPDDQVLNCTWMRCDASIKTVDVGLRRRARHHPVQPRAAVAPARSLRQRTSAGVLRPALLPHVRQGRKLGVPAARPSTCSWPTATGPPTRSSPRSAAGRPCSSVGRTVRSSGPTAVRRGTRSCASGGGKRDWKGTDTIHEAGRLLGIDGRGVRAQGPLPARPRPRVRRRRGVRGRQLVRGVLPARPRGHGLRRPAGHHRQRRVPRVRHRRRDGAGGAAP